jgi:6-pyruvoyltetrahydropterin/6-carboxytetrahydropterin synthase
MDHQLVAASRTGLLVLSLAVPASLTRTVSFHAEHRLYRPEWSEAKNREVFGAVTEPPGHGHEYRCGVTVQGPLKDGGMIIDLGLLDAIIDQEVLARFKGKHINLDVPEFAYGKTLPTCEALATYIFRLIARRLPAGVALARVRVAEDSTLFADCTGND